MTHSLIKRCTAIIIMKGSYYHSPQSCINNIAPNEHDNSNNKKILIPSKKKKRISHLCHSIKISVGKKNVIHYTQKASDPILEHTTKYV